MRRLAVTLAIALPFVLPAHADKPRKPKPALPAAQYPLHDAHPKERVTIAAEPGDTKETAPNTRLDYAHHGFMPFRVIVTNDSDTALSLDDARIHFISADDAVVQAATDDELQRRLFSRKSVNGTKIPMPAPIPSITIHHAPVDKQILADDNDFGFPTTTIAPHTTVSGYLYYDTRDLDEPVLEHSTLEVRRVHFVGTDKELDSFEILLKSTPDAKSASPSAPTKPTAAKD
jgi:hypothetical protein